MTDLILPLKREYFEAIKRGEKVEEYRLCTPYWAKRLRGRRYGQIVLTLGYPKHDDHERRIIKPWRGYVERTIQHPHFGPEPVRVFAIYVGA
ncbi:ASCH domain-containing protein [Paraburkholderia caffeinilytica]|uniref:ASCH domain-containing protein n=1 Tax=Paraburkholderia caffeinilytica TaxID=1761016 RepID=UPI0038BE0D9F